MVPIFLLPFSQDLSSIARGRVPPCQRHWELLTQPPTAPGKGTRWAGTFRLCPLPDTSQSKQRGCSEGRSAGLGQKSRVARGTSSHSQGHPARSSPWRHGSVQAVMTSPAYPSPWLPCATGALPALALSLVPVLALEAYVSPGLLHCPRSYCLPGHGTGRCVAGSALWPWLRTPFPGQAPERGAGTDTDCRYSRARPVSCDMSYLMAVPQEPEIP